MHSIKIKSIKKRIWPVSQICLLSLDNYSFIEPKFGITKSFFVQILVSANLKHSEPKNNSADSGSNKTITLDFLAARRLTENSEMVPRKKERTQR